MILRFPRILSFLFSCLILCNPALAITEVQDNKSGQELTDTGRTHFKQGRYEEALADWKLALETFKSSDDKQNQALLLLYRAEAYLAIGQHFKAINNLKMALNLAEMAEDYALVNRVTGSLGTAYMLSNQLDKARELLENTIHNEHLAGHMHVAAVAGNNLGNLLASQGKYTEAIPVYKRAISDAEKSANADLVAKGMVNIARVMVDQNDHVNAINQLELASNKVSELPDSHVKAYAYISIGRLYTQLLGSNEISRPGIDSLATSALETAEKIAVSSDDQRAMSYASGYMGELREQMGDIAAAMNSNRKALVYLHNIQAPEISYRWQWQEGRLLKAQGQTDLAINAYQRAVDDLQKVRNIMAARTASNRDFRNGAGQLYMELADLLLKRSENIKDNNELEIELHKVRSTVEMLKSAELEDYFRDDCVDALKKKTSGIDQIGENTAAIYPVIFHDRLEILISFPDGLKRYTVAVTEKELNDEINRFRKLLEKRTTHQYKRQAINIYNWLVKPLEQDLEKQQINTLVFIPDGALRTIPLSALYDGKEFLVSRYAVATSPGLTLTDPQPLPRKNIKLLVAGLTEGVQGFPPLPDVADEVKRIDELYDASLLQNTSFTQNNIEKELNNQTYSIVHVASHGKFKHDVRDTFLLTYDGKINMDLLEGYMASTAYRERPVELLTLSACQTAMGDDKAALGLGGVAVKAGARSALATLWYINDQASSLLVQNFYTNLKDTGISKAKALQIAQQSLLKDPRFKHPSYWAPFLLIGNWL